MSRFEATLAIASALLLVGCVGSVESGDNGPGPDASTSGGDDGSTPGPDAMPSPLAGWCTSQPANFSFFVTSMSALWTLSGDDISNLDGGFGGNFGGLAGADQICQTIALATGHGDKTWRAFLSSTNGGSPIHAIDRIGTGPWYDANGRLVATGREGLLSNNRPDGDVQSTSDLPDECGVPLSALGDAHDVVTGSNSSGMLNNSDPESTCNDWTSSSGTVGGNGTLEGGLVMCGHSFPRSASNGLNWMSDHQLRGCGKGANLLNNGAGSGSCIGCTGGYGAFYCFAQ